MNDLINKLYKNNTIIYKVLLFLIVVIAIVYLFPKGGQFKYDFSQGKPWQYGNLYAPFDFAIQKTPDEIESEKKVIAASVKKYFVVDETIKNDVLSSFANKMMSSDSLSIKTIEKLQKKGIAIINNIYANGFLDDVSVHKVTPNEIIVLRTGNAIHDISVSKMMQSKDILRFIYCYLVF
mgnify:CR=1 FL=1